MSKKLIGLIVALVVCCCCSICMMSSSIGAFYSCTGGTLEPQFFDSAKCLNAGDAVAPGVSAQFVRVQATKKDHLNLSEIIVVDEKGKNVALGKAVEASSVHEDTIPGNVTSGLGRANYAVTTNESENEFLEVDLGSEVMIKKVIVLNRSSCCKERLKGCHLALSNKDKEEVAKSGPINIEAEAYAWKTGSQNVDTIKFDQVDAEMLNKSIKGQFIKLTHTKKNVVINLAELVVFNGEDKETNLAQGKTVTANSVHPAGPLANLVDGKPDNFAHTNGPANVEDHMLVDLGEELEFSGITIKNRKDCCQERAVGIQVEVLNADKKVIVRTTPIPDIRHDYTFDFIKFEWS